LVSQEFDEPEARRSRKSADGQARYHEVPLESSATSAPRIDIDQVDSTDTMGKKTIGVHCVAGLGRAPVLVAVALIENGMEPFEAIQFIRTKRMRAMNARQIRYLESYKPKRQTTGENGCVVC